MLWRREAQISDQYSSPLSSATVICNLPAPPALWSRHHAVWRVTCDQSVTSVTVTVVSHCAVQKSRLSKQCAWQVAWPGMCYTLHCVALHSVSQCVTVCYSVLHGECSGGTDTHSWLRLRRSEAGPLHHTRGGQGRPHTSADIQTLPWGRDFPMNTLVFSYNLMDLIEQRYRT